MRRKTAGGLCKHREPKRSSVSSRAAAGTTAAAARIARSTVLDAFRLGRRRINPDLVAEIVVTLGHSLWLAVLSANLLSSLTDKRISGAIALFAVRILQPLGLRDRNTDTRDPRRSVS